MRHLIKKLSSAIFIGLAGCVDVSTHMIVGPGTTDETGGYTKTQDTQTASDVNNEVASRISGIDKSNQEITKNLDKQTKMLKENRERDYVKDKSDPHLPKEKRKKLYKRDVK